MIIKNLAIEQWKFRQLEDTDWLPATVPGCIHTDLLKNEKINNHPCIGNVGRGR